MKVCVATGTRAEYGLLKPLIDRIQAEPKLSLQVLVTGAHLSPEFGLTYRQIEQDGVKITVKVEMLLSSDTAEGITKSMGIGLIGYAAAFNQLKPDLLVILGDRYEMLALAAAALIYKIPIAHLHGGEITAGAYDDSIRHAITKLSHLHFTSTAAYRQRVIQLGEQPGNVFNVGAIGLDQIYSLQFLSRAELEKALNIRFQKYNYIVAFHPETWGALAVEEQFQCLLDAIAEEENSFFIFTGANADTNGRIINQMMAAYAHKNQDKAALFSSLGTLKFLSVMKIADAIIGNSSSGIIEAPSIRTATINIGDRQKGRIQAGSVLNCTFNKKAITEALKTVKSASFKNKLQEVDSPYGNGTASDKILEVINNVDLSALHLKSFYNCSYE